MGQVRSRFENGPSQGGFEVSEAGDVLGRGGIKPGEREDGKPWGRLRGRIHPARGELRALDGERGVFPFQPLPESRRAFVGPGDAPQQEGFGAVQDAESHCSWAAIEELDFEGNEGQRSTSGHHERTELMNKPAFGRFPREMGDASGVDGNAPHFRRQADWGVAGKWKPRPPWTFCGGWC